MAAIYTVDQTLQVNDYYSKVIRAKRYKNMIQAILKRGEKPEPRSRRLLGLLPSYCCDPDNAEWMASTYCRLQRILDYFTGMTDTHAVSTFKKIKGISLPGMLF